MIRVVLFAAVFSGCSALVVRGPTPEAPKRCTQSAEVPILIDTVGGAGALVLGVAALLEAPNASTEGSAKSAAIGIGVGLFAVSTSLVLSAIYGIRTVDRCNRISSL